MSSIMVDSIESIQELIEEIESSALEAPFLFIDLEGSNLSRHGSIAIMQILVPPKRAVYLVDVTTLKEKVFGTRSAAGLTLKNILESEKFPKIFFDVRNDSDALYSHYGVHLQCVVDIQLLEFATRRRGGRFLNGLAKCISQDCPLDSAKRREWQDVKDTGSKLFAPEKGGNYEVFHQRPLPADIVKYCVQDVLLLPTLLAHYAGLLSDRLAFQIQSEAIRRVELSQSPYFNGKARHMAIGPSFSPGRLDPQLSHPMSVVMSPELFSYCALDADSEAKVVLEQYEQARGSHTTSPGTASRSEIPQSGCGSSVGPIAQALASLQINRDYEREEDDDDFGNFGHRRFYFASVKDHSPPEDFAACDRECDWCGNCRY